MKLALADRDTFYADPLFADVPLAALLSARICRAPARADRPQARLARAPARRSPSWQGDSRSGRLIRLSGTFPPPPAPAHDTTTCVVADQFGNVVAATPSGWSGVVAGDTGVWLGSRLQSFNVWSDHPNVIEPGKRPRITLSPTLVLETTSPCWPSASPGATTRTR